MDERTFRKTLSKIPLGGFRYYEQTGSTNDIALSWAAEGARDLSLVYAEEQTAGRGRGSRGWFTPPNAALAFSLVIRPHPGEEGSIPLFSALGALAVCDILATYGVEPAIKWPNDILLNRRKVCGILAESVWLGEKVDAVVLGIGLNIKPEAVPPLEELNFPATCLEAEMPPPLHQFPAPEQAGLLQKIIQSILDLRPAVATDFFLQAWESRLAFCHEQVEIWADGRVAGSGKVDGLERDGSLRLLAPNGQVSLVHFGEVHLRVVTT